jgi:hypothetical protein
MIDSSAREGCLIGRKEKEVEKNFCRKCNRTLSNPEAIYGPKCWHRLRGPVAELQRSRNKAAQKAADLLLTGGLVRQRGHGGRVWRAVSSDGTRSYLTALEACTCDSGRYSAFCNHRAALSVLLAA